MTDCLIIGGTGSLGQRLIEDLLPQHEIAVYSRDEAKHWTIQNALGCGPLAGRARRALRFYVGDVRDAARLREVICASRPESVIIASALKQVDTCELSPGESVKTNLLGVRNVVEAVAELAPMVAELRSVLLVSTDKACAPVNVYGMCKAIAERIVTSKAIDEDRRVKYLAVRYGNVLESRGSIIPLFRHQAENAECLTVTSPDMTRYVMTLSQSVDLIMHALEYGESGDTWVPRLPAMRVGDLADLFSQRSGKPIKIIGLRPGEKMHEDLINESESARTRSQGDEHFVISPAYRQGEGTRFTYSSADRVMSKDDLSALLGRLGVLDRPLDQFKGLAIEEIATNRRD